MAFKLIQVLLALALLVGPVGQASQHEKLTVIATTAILADFAQAVGGELIELYTIAPAGICPAHYDIRPSDIHAIAQAPLILYHGIEPWLPDLIASSGNVNVKRIQVSGEWNIPPNASKLVGEIAEALAEIDPADAESFHTNAQRYQGKIAALDQELQAAAAELELSRVKAIVMAWQQEFVDWLGVTVVAVFRPPEMLSLKEANELVRIGRAEGVALVIDNLQSGVDFGARLSFAVGAVHVVLTNFPGTLPHTETYLAMVRHNAEQLFAAVRTHRGEE